MRWGLAVRSDNRLAPARAWAGLLVTLSTVMTAPAAAQSGPAAACRFALAGTGMVVAVKDGRSFTLDHGREVRLAALEVPPSPEAKAALQSLVAGKAVELRQQTAGTDRYGRVVAHIYLAGENRRSVAHELLAQGQARVGAPVGDKACAAELLAAEQAARAAKRGLWSDPNYGIVAAESLAALTAGRGRFTLVEGRVASVRESGGTIYVNFGRRWSQALTVTILKRHEGLFTAAGIAPKLLTNRRVRVRGWLDERSGPRIEAASPEQIEIAELNR
jgi:endonuclease YncB( thermonuclease family)